ncbi:MAG: hypothetical protein QOF12_312 [Solirubrobacteraceae bacterium]|jgi:hypothetical protein|nr:hypothetical protein [Solirubrobacteraceae bacterium]
MGVVLLSLAALPGCGNTPSKPPVVTTPSRVSGMVPQLLPAQGIGFQRPANWHYTAGQAPLLATVNSGLVTIAIWRYPRAEPLPTTAAQLATARNALVAAAKARDPTLKVIKAKGTRAAHHPAVVIIADETVAGQPRRVRSTHIYGAGSEYVVDAFAPADQYAQVETPVFRALVRSVKLSKPTG